MLKSVTGWVPSRFVTWAGAAFLEVVSSISSAGRGQNRPRVCRIHSQYEQSAPATTRLTDSVRGCWRD